ncbi:MAG TPA: LacI family DNA-binding transcriptional regulator [Bryobacteraceae bacterium]|nr:LacI family DNA-binding transcriptional regulator [Bryobacteraceae bacterium]
MARQSKSVTTIVDIARKLKLSPMTVSRALTGNREVSERTRQKVLRTATALGYQPNRWARSLVTRRSSIIGIVIPDISHSFFAEITCGVEEVIEKSGYDILLCHSRSNAERERSEISMLVGSRVDGLIVASVQPEQSPEPFTRLTEMKVPFVLVDRFFPKSEFASVRVDDRIVGRLATECLIALGHRRIAHIEGRGISPGSFRKLGHLDALKAASIASRKEWILEGDFSLESGREAMRAILRMKPRPTAVFAANDPMAVGAVYACRDAGLRVPEDISIVGAGNIESPHHPNPFLTTVDWPREELGRVAATILLESIKPSGEMQPTSKVFEPRLLIRQSTGRRTG